MTLPPYSGHRAGEKRCPSDETGFSGDERQLVPAAAFAGTLIGSYEPPRAPDQRRRCARARRELRLLWH